MKPSIASSAASRGCDLLLARLVRAFFYGMRHGPPGFSVHGDINQTALNSYNHLRAFASNIQALTGQPYVAQVLSQETVDSILGS
ncbi:MAG: hypothetical protein L0Y45_08305 [Woeseiaceae bacterium]|nr:hypothetical protein [Woeseiaceae bacterium]